MDLLHLSDLEATAQLMEQLWQFRIARVVMAGEPRGVFVDLGPPPTAAPVAPPCPNGPAMT